MLPRSTPTPFRSYLQKDSLHWHSAPHRRNFTTTQLQPWVRAILKNRKTVRRSSTSAFSTAPPASRSIPARLARFAAISVLTAGFFATGLIMSAGTETVAAVNGVIKPPTDAETLLMYTPVTPKAIEVDEHIKNHPYVQKLRNTPGMKEARPHLKIPEAMRPHNLTGGVLLGEGKIEVPPLIFADNEAELPSLYSFSYLGKSICGHPGIIHGGMLATMLDEGLARACFPALPNKVGVTANLKIDYRVPCPAGRYVVLKAFTTKVEGRKAWVKGWIELLGDDDEGEGVKLVEAEALFIEPKNAAILSRFYADK